MPKVSIIIPTYNSSKFIKRTIGSVLSQTFRDWELIIVDDCSKDSTELAVREFTKFDKRIKFFKTPENSGGPATPKNIGIEKAEGEYVAFLDHDDEWFPEKLASQLSVFENSKDDNLGLISCGANLINKKGKKFSIYNPKNIKVNFPDILLKNPIYSNSSVLIKKNVIDIVGGRDDKMKYSEDWEMWIRICRNGYKIHFIEKPLFNYYFHDTNVTKATKDSLIKVRDAEYVFEKHRDLYEKYEYVHVGWFRLGVMYFLGGDKKKSRECFQSSQKIKKSFIPAKIGYFLTFLGKLGVIKINFFIFLYRLAHGRTYLIKTEGI